MKKVVELACDFETTRVKLKKNFKNLKTQINTDIIQEYPEVYVWDIALDLQYAKHIPKSKNWRTKQNNGLMHIYGLNVYSFVECIMNFKCDIEVIFHNLKGFDGHFIMPALTNLGFTRKPKEERRKLLPFEFEELANKNAKIYSIKLGALAYKRTNGKVINRVITIKDNLLLFPGSIAQFGKLLATDAINNGMKEEVAYEKYQKQIMKDANGKSYMRYEPYKDFDELEKDGNTLEYTFQDTNVLFWFREKMALLLPRKFWGLTAASTAYKEFLRAFGDTIFKKNFGSFEQVQYKYGLIKYKLPGGKKAYFDYEIKEKLAKSIIPVDWLNKPYNDYDSIFEYINQNYYTGGLVWSNEDYRGVIQPEISVADIVSAHPSGMNSDNLYPVGEPFIGNKKEYAYKLYEVEILKTIVNKHGLPFVYSQQNESREYLKTLKKGMIVYLDSNEYKRFLTYYSNDKSKFRASIKLSFKAIEGRKIFGPFVDKWFKLKNEGKETGNVFLELLAKLFLNSLYGKFGSKKLITSKLWNNETMHWDEYQEDTDARYYLPWASCTTSLTRMKLVDAVGYNYKYALGGDTDSVFWIGPREALNANISKNLGDFEWETKFTYYGVMRRPKQYCFVNDEAYAQGLKKARKIAIAGIRLHVDDLEKGTIDNSEHVKTFYETLKVSDFIFGKKIPLQLSPIRVYGYGIVFDEIEKDIKPVWDYNPLTEQFRTEPQDFIKEFIGWKLKHENI